MEVLSTMGSESGDNQPANAFDTALEDDGASDSLTDTTVSVDDLFDVLARPANRYVLTYLLQSDEPVYAHELVEYILEETEPPEEISEAEYRGQIDSRLLHASLPKLEDVGLVEFDARRQLVSETDETPTALPYLRFALMQQSGVDE
jgi:predicted transcriptional regulator